MTTRGIKFAAAFLGASIVALAACADKVTTCSLVGITGVVLNIFDAADRRNLESVATVTVRALSGEPITLSGTAKDAIRLTSSPGPFAVTVSAPGYRTTYDTVTVGLSGGRCPEVVPTTRQIPLSRLP